MRDENIKEERHQNKAKTITMELKRDEAVKIRRGPEEERA